MARRKPPKLGSAASTSSKVVSDGILKPKTQRGPPKVRRLSGGLLDVERKHWKYLELCVTVMSNKNGSKLILTILQHQTQLRDITSALARRDPQPHLGVRPRWQDYPLLCAKLSNPNISDRQRGQQRFVTRLPPNLRRDCPITLPHEYVLFRFVLEYPAMAED